MKIKIAFSPCPNDTFIFHHLIHSDSNNISWSAVYLDVSELNHRAIHEKKYPVTKLSFAAMARLQGDYQLLDCGGAMGRGCGPLLIHNHSPMTENDLAKIKKVLVPGTWTTANLLLHLYLKSQNVDLDSIEFIPTKYDLIIPEIKRQQADFGLLIHEERFSYKKFGLHCLVDLGKWWEDSTGHPIPLGCIAAKKDLGPGMISDIEAGIRKSIDYGYKHPEESIKYIKKHSQSLDDDVIRSHINLYVNDFSLGYGQEGTVAIQELFRQASLVNIKE